MTDPEDAYDVDDELIELHMQLTDLRYRLEALTLLLSKLHPSVNSAVLDAYAKDLREQDEMGKR